MAIANRTCVSFCNQPKAHYLATSRESRRYVVAGASFWLRQENRRIGFPWVRDKFYMDGKRFNACQTHRSMYTSIFNRFPVIEPESSPF